MASDPRRMRPSSVIRMLNSTPLGEVMTTWRLRDDRNRAGYRIGDDKNVDVIRYAAWLVWNRHRQVERQSIERGTVYDAAKEAARLRNAQMSAAGRDIGEIPAVVDPDRKARCESSFRSFCESYFADRFTLAWSDDHLKVINKIEQSVRGGGLYAVAMPRGSGKTTICECAVLWAVLYGDHPFTFLIGSCEDHAVSMLDNLKAELMHNEMLFEDFPESIYAVRCLENQSRRCTGQLHNGNPTHISWQADRIILPSIPGSDASGALIRVAGLTGNLRGAVHTRPDGCRVRPSLVILDDPQTDQSARSPSQCVSRERIIAGAVLGLAGPGKKISGIMPCTVITPGDMADNILDRDKHPAWQGERTKMIYTLPSDEGLWEKYAQIRADSLRNDGDGHEATKFYRRNRKAMDAGAEVAWEARFNEDELSAIQHAMNLKLRDERSFWAEYQNEPMPLDDVAESVIAADEISQKLNTLPRKTIPLNMDKLTCFIDVQGSCLFYVVAAWADDFTGAVVDYGTYPDQKREYFSLRDVKRTLGRAKPGAGFEGALYDGLKTLTEALFNKAWIREDGAEIHIDQGMIDANWGDSTGVVRQFCRQSTHAAILMPSHGRGIGAANVQLNELRKKQGEKVGHYWKTSLIQRQKHILYDTNYWKSFIYARLVVAMGDKGCLSLFGKKAATHRMIADHLVAETPIETTGRGRVVTEWKVKPGRPDNHWFDCLVGCAVAASIQGASLTGMVTQRKKREPIKLSDIQRRRRMWG